MVWRGKAHLRGWVRKLRRGRERMGRRWHAHLRRWHAHLRRLRSRSWIGAGVGPRICTGPWIGRSSGGLRNLDLLCPRIGAGINTGLCAWIAGWRCHRGRGPHHGVLFRGLRQWGWGFGRGWSHHHVHRTLSLTLTLSLSLQQRHHLLRRHCIHIHRGGLLDHVQLAHEEQQRFRELRMPAQQFPRFVGITVGHLLQLRNHVVHLPFTHAAQRIGHRLGAVRATTVSVQPTVTFGILGGGAFVLSPTRMLAHIHTQFPSQRFQMARIAEIHPQGSPVQIESVEVPNRREGRLWILEFDKRESAGFPRF
mmetsp:Transcript_54197/g.63316  ORF Transcript_54197/g.63316 Transcript_54197/m.63316 type:complete len:308 (-) Transcript_54197:723-1646(-)